MIGTSTCFQLQHRPLSRQACTCSQRPRIGSQQPPRTQLRSALSRREGLGLAASSLLLHKLRGSAAVAMASKEEDPPEPKDFAYTHLWTSADGETHIKEAFMSGFEMKKYADTEQWVKQGYEPTKIVFTELPVGNYQPFHSCPQTQFVITLAGSWFVKTTDGTKKVFVAGDVLFQDDTEDNPAAKAPTHESGVVGDQPNQQLIVQVNRKPEVDNPGCL